MTQKIRVQLCKQVPVKFVSHLDFAKVLERAIRRAELPIAFSEGFNPHMKISFGTVLPLGMTSDSEFVDFEFTKDIDPQELKKTLNNELPGGFAVIDAKILPHRVASLMTELNLVRYTVDVELDKIAMVAQLQDVIADFLAMDQIWIEKKTKSKTAKTDIRPMIEKIAIIEQQPPHFRLEMWLGTGSTGNLRPEQVITAMQQYGMVSDCTILGMHRSGLFKKEGNLLRTPWELI